MKNILLVIGALSIGLFTGCKKDLDQPLTTPLDPAASAISRTANEQQLANLSAPSEIIVKFKPGTKENNKNGLLARINGVVKKRVQTRTMKAFGDEEGFYVITVPSGISQAISHAKAFADVEFAEPNYRYTHTATANDPYASVSYLWGMHTGFGSQAVTAWGKNQIGNSSVVVGVIDEGVNYAHPDLKDNIWKNPGEIENNGVDDDRNGYIDDVYGWDFYNNDKTVYDTTADDHGTHVAGTIGAKGNNGVGVAGVCWNVKMITAKFLGPNGGVLSDAVEAIDYMVNLKMTKAINLVALNNSWGGGGYSTALSDAINRAYYAGILFIAAAGNGDASGVGFDIDKQPVYPASYTNGGVIAVAAIDANGALARFSNYGFNSVDLAAPGVQIASTIPGGGYAYYSGTSMATPHVAGAVALYVAAKGLQPKKYWDAGAIKNAILNAARNTRTTSLYQKVLTTGRLNVSVF